ncbi:MAG: iron-containing alcohol dehydrogenase family protein [Ruminococcaceae bacterium]|nr:iron-containing alcohol dehydrogenase family protein [Oscillospiraceae bacterium]
MATKSKVVETSFRLGAGRYIQEEGAISRIGEEIERLGKYKPFILGSKTAIKITKELIDKSLAEKNISAVYYTYEGFCNEGHCERIVASEEFKNCDIVIGVGGGNMMDAAKLCACLANKFVINIPTSSATCAAYTPLSVTYNDRGQKVRTVHHSVEVNAVLVDMDILCRQPIRLLVSGVYDALAKTPELNQRILGKSEDEVDIGLRSSYVMSEFIYNRMLEDLSQAVVDTKEEKSTKAVYDIVYLAIAVTGVISGLARGSNQCAIAHKVYEVCRSLYPEIVYPALHGELVAIGLICQLAYNGESEEAVKAFSAQMKSLGMPISFTDVGINADDECIEVFYQKVVSSDAMAGTSEEEQARLKKSLELIR